MLENSAEARVETLRGQVAYPLATQLSHLPIILKSSVRTMGLLETVQMTVILLFFLYFFLAQFHTAFKRWVFSVLKRDAH